MLVGGVVCLIKVQITFSIPPNPNEGTTCRSLSAALGRTAMHVNNVSGDEYIPVLTLPNSQGLSSERGMRTRLERDTGESVRVSHTPKKANVADGVSYGEPGAIVES